MKLEIVQNNMQTLINHDSREAKFNRTTDQIKFVMVQKRITVASKFIKPVSKKKRMMWSFVVEGCRGYSSFASHVLSKTLVPVCCSGQ